MLTASTPAAAGADRFCADAAGASLARPALPNAGCSAFEAGCASSLFAVAEVLPGPLNDGGPGLQRWWAAAVTSRLGKCAAGAGMPK